MTTLLMEAVCLVGGFVLGLRYRRWLVAHYQGLAVQADQRCEAWRRADVAQAKSTAHYLGLFVEEKRKREELELACARLQYELGKLTAHG